MRVDRFLRHARDVTHRVLDARAVAAEAAVRDLHQRRDHRRGGDAKYGQAPVHVEQCADEPDDRQAVADQRYRRVRGRIRDQFDVVRELRQEVARLLPVQVGRRQAQVMREHVASQPLDDLAADVPGEIIGYVVADAAQREQDDDARRYRPQDLRVPLDERAVEEDLDEIRERRVAGREHDHAEHADEIHADIGPRISQQAPVDRPRPLALRRRGGGRRRRAQGVPSSCVVAMLSCAKPSRPATSIAVTTD